MGQSRYGEGRGWASSPEGMKSGRATSLTRPGRGLVGVLPQPQAAGGLTWVSPPGPTRLWSAAFSWGRRGIVPERRTCPADPVPGGVQPRAPASHAPSHLHAGEPHLLPRPGAPCPGGQLRQNGSGDSVESVAGVCEQAGGNGLVGRPHGAGGKARGVRGVVCATWHSFPVCSGEGEVVRGAAPPHPPGLQAVNWRLWSTGPRVGQLRGRPGSRLCKTAPFLRVTAVCTPNDVRGSFPVWRYLVGTGGASGRSCCWDSSGP